MPQSLLNLNIMFICTIYSQNLTLGNNSPNSRSPGLGNVKAMFESGSTVSKPISPSSLQQMMSVKSGECLRSFMAFMLFFNVCSFKIKIFFIELYKIVINH